MSRKLSRRALRGTIMLAACGGAASVASPALAAHFPVTGSCSNGQTYTISGPGNHSSVKGGWGTSQITAGGAGALTPTTVSVTVFDATVGQTVLTVNPLKGQANANQNQQMITCMTTEDGTVADFVPPGTPLPDGALPTDSAVNTLTVTFVLKPAGMSA